jgi:hypothetical protein
MTKSVTTQGLKAHLLLLSLSPPNNKLQDFSKHHNTFQAQVNQLDHINQ